MNDKTWPVNFWLALEYRISDNQKESFTYAKGDSLILSTSKFQFHYFSGVDHSFNKNGPKFKGLN